MIMSEDEIKKFKEMSLEEQKADVLYTMSNAIRGMSEQIATMKRAFILRHDGTEEAFDKALYRELDAAYSKVKDMTDTQLTFHMIADLVSRKGLDIVEIFEGEDEDA